MCDTLSQPEHGIVSVTGTIPGATALYSCNQGYRLSDPGRAQRTCGLHSVWSGSAPTCQREYSLLCSGSSYCMIINT